MDGAEQELVSRCLEGKEKAWADFVRSHTRRIYNMSYRFTRCRAEAEDATQDVFIRVYQTLKSYRAEAGSLSGWLSRVARNLLIDHHRKANRREPCLPITEPEHQFEDRRAPDPLQFLVRDEAAAILHEALRRLPPNTRRVVVLHDLYDMPLEGVAVLLRIPLGTVKSRMIRGRRELARILRRPANHGR